MAKDYFRECKEIIDSILQNMKKTNEYDDSAYYTIDILNVDEECAKVRVCDSYRYLAKEEGGWVVLPEAGLDGTAV